MDLRAAPERHELEAALIRPAGEDRIPARLLLRFGQIKSVEDRHWLSVSPPATILWRLTGPKLRQPMSWNI